MKDALDARIAHLDALIAQTTHVPSLPTLAARRAQLTETVCTLTARVQALEQECHALRQRELLRLWDPEASED